MDHVQLKFLQILCSLYDGENYVPESRIRAAWPDCPSHNAILNLGNGIYFECNYNLQNPGYLPTPQGLSQIAQSKSSDRIANATEEQVKIAQQEAIEAKTEAKRATRQARIANVIALISALIALASWLVPGSSLLSFLQAIFARL